MDKKVEGILLTGGKSQRMGANKADILVNGVPQGVRVAREMAKVCSQVRILGREPLPGFHFEEDRDSYEGPFVVLQRFKPVMPLVFVASCDMPAFHSEVIVGLMKSIGESQVCTVEIDGFLQPLCSLYSADCFARLVNFKSLTSWLISLSPTVLGQPELAALGIDCRWVRSANTPAEFEGILASLHNESS